MSFRRVARRTARRTAGRNQPSAPPPAASPQTAKDNQSVEILKTRLAKGEITKEEYEDSLKLLQK